MKNRRSFWLELALNLGAPLAAALVTYVGGLLALMTVGDMRDFWRVGLGLAVGVALPAALFWRRRRISASLSAVAATVAALAFVLTPVQLCQYRDAKRAEAEHMLGSLKGEARVAYAKRGLIPQTLTGPVDQGGCEVRPEELLGERFRVLDQVLSIDGKGKLIATPLPGNESEGVCVVTFNWGGGDGRFAWAGGDD